MSISSAQLQQHLQNQLQNAYTYNQPYNHQITAQHLAGPQHNYPFGAQSPPPLSPDEQAKVDEIHYRASARALAQRFGKMSLEDEEALRFKYPTLGAAWDNYQIILKMCLSEEK